MGDYVPFATADSPAKSGFNGFPFPLEEWTGTVQEPWSRPETIFQYLSYVAVDMQTAIRWVWRVRKWKLAVSVSVSGFAEQGDPPSRPYTAGPLTAETILESRYKNFPKTVNRERDIPLSSWQSVWTTSGKIQNGPVSITQGGEFYWLNHPDASAVALFFGAKAKIDYSTQKVYIPFACAINAVSSPLGGGTTIVFGEFGDDLYHTRKQFTAYIDGIPTTWEYLDRAVSTVTAISVKIDPIEYWPYAAPEKILYPQKGYNVGDPHPNAGQPIYDTRTGAQIRDPVTGF